MSQRELAEKVRINFTYLSKIETETMNPPSANTISSLGDALHLSDAERDELFGLAGKIPSDLAGQVGPKMIEYLRSYQDELGKLDESREAVNDKEETS